MNVTSKYMCDLVIREENRIENEMFGMAFDALLTAGYRMTVSKDGQNISERNFKITAKAARYALSDDDNPHFWIFAYAPEKKRSEQPVIWIKGTPGNVGSVLTDYSLNAERYMKAIEKHACKYD